MAHCCPSSSFGTSRRGWSFWWGRRFRWWRVTKKNKKSAKSKGGREIGALGELTESKYEEVKKEGRTCEMRRREDPPSALSAVNGVHVADDLSQALRLFTLRRDRSTVRHLRGFLVISSKDHVGPSKMNAIRLSCAISS